MEMQRGPGIDDPRGRNVSRLLIIGLGREPGPSPTRYRMGRLGRYGLEDLDVDTSVSTRMKIDSFVVLTAVKP
jgi:hypothetical protein